MQFRFVLWTEQQKNRMHGLSIKRVEIQASGMQSNGGDAFFHFQSLDMRHRNTVTKSCRAFFLALNHGLEKIIAVRGFECSAFHQRVKKFAYALVALGGFHSRHDCFFKDQLAKFHANDLFPFGHVVFLAECSRIFFEKKCLEK